MDTDIKVTINLNKIVENRIKQMGAYRDFAEKSIQGTLVSTDDIDTIAVKSRSCIDFPRESTNFLCNHHLPVSKYIISSELAYEI